MYVCGAYELKLEGGRVVKRGEPVPEAEKWPTNILQANLRIGHLKLKSDKDAEDARWTPAVATKLTVVTKRPSILPQSVLQQLSSRNANAVLLPVAENVLPEATFSPAEKDVALEEESTSATSSLEDELLGPDPELIAQVTTAEPPPPKRKRGRPKKGG